MRRLAVVVATLVLGLLTSACGGGSTMTLKATFDDVGDLVTGHAVQIADVRVGKITGIKLTKDFRAEVTMHVRGSLHVPARSEALLRTTSLLGEKFVELRPLDTDHPTTGPFLKDGDVVRETAQAPELEFVAEQAVRVLGGVVSTDLASLIHTGAVGFGQRGPELRSLIGDLSVITKTLADRTGDITSIVDNLASASSTLAAGSGDLDKLLVNLADTTKVLADNRDKAVTALDQLSRLARVQEDEVFKPHMADVDRQLKQVDAVLGEVVSATADVDSLITWLQQFAAKVPRGIPQDFAQVYAWFAQS